MAVPLGRYTHEGLDRSKLRFEKGRRTALGVAEGVVGAGLSNSISDLSARMSAARQERHETETERLAPDVLPRPKYQTPESVVGREIPGAAKGRISAVEQFLREEGLPVDELTPELKQQFAFATDDQVLAAARSKNLGELVYEKGRPSQSTKFLSFEGGEPLPGTGPIGGFSLPEAAALPVGAVFGPGVTGANVGRSVLGAVAGEAAARGTAKGLQEAGVTSPYVTIPATLGAGLVGGVGGFTAPDIARVAGRPLTQAAARQAKTILDNQEIVTLYHGTNRDAAAGIKASGLNPESGLTTNRQIAELFAKNNYGPDAEVLEFRVPRPQLRNPNPRETWFVVSDQPQKPVTGVRRLATEFGGTKYEPQEPGLPTPDELAFGPSASRAQRTPEQVRESLRRKFAGESPDPTDPYSALEGLPTPDELAFGPPEARTGLQPQPIPKKDYTHWLDQDLEARVRQLDALREEPGVNALERDSIVSEQIDIIEEMRRRREGVGPGTPQGPPRGIEETGIPGEVPEIEGAIPPPKLAPDIDRRYPGLRQQLAAALRGEIKPSRTPTKRGQYIGPALRRTLLEAGYTKEEIAELSRLRPVGGGAEGAGAFEVPGRKTPTPGTAPSPRTAPQFGPEVKPPAKVDKVVKSINDAVDAGTMTRQDADRILEQVYGTQARMFGEPVGTQGQLFDQPAPTGPILAPTETGTQFRLRTAQRGLGAPGPDVPPSLEAVQHEFPDLLESVKKVVPQRSLPAAVYDEIVGALGVSLTSVTSGDIGSRFRNSIMLGIWQPKDWIKNWKPVVQSAFSASKAEQAELAVRRNLTFSAGDPALQGINPKAIEALRQGVPELHLYEYGLEVAPGERVPGFTGINQSYVSRTFRRLAPWSVGSERNLAVDFNLTGSGMYRDVGLKMAAAGEIRPERYIALAKNLNHARFYGDFNPGRILPGINAFISGRALVGRFQVYLDPILQPGSFFRPSARQQAAKNIVGLVAADLALLGLASGTLSLIGAGNSVQVNPLSKGADWLKLRVGNTRLDPWASMLPIARLITHMGAAAVTDLGGPDTGYDMADIRRELGQFFTNKEAPIVRLFTDATGVTKPFGGKKLASTETLVDLYAPFFATDVYDAVKEYGFKGAAVAPVSQVGIGAQTYTAYQDTAAGQLQQIPQYTGIDPEIQRKIVGVGRPGDDFYQAGFFDKVDEFRDALVREEGFTAAEVEDIPWAVTAQEVAEREGVDEEFLSQALILHTPRLARTILNPDWLQFVIDHEDELRKDRPFMFDRQLDDFLNRVHLERAAGQ